MDFNPELAIPGCEKEGRGDQGGRGEFRRINGFQEGGGEILYSFLLTSDLFRRIIKSMFMNSQLFLFNQEITLFFQISFFIFGCI